jgi:Tfp pilus assembly protein PilN
MKAVNLIPDEQRRGAGGTAGRSGGVAYACIGVLAGIVVMVALYAMTSSTITTRQSDLDTLNQQIAASQTQSTELSAFSAKAAEAASRKQTITELVSTRFAWGHALREIPRVLPKDVWLQSMSGTVAANTDAAAAVTTTPSGPSIDIQGCTTSQNEVAKLMSSLKLIDGVQDVTLVKSAKPDNATGAGTCTVRSSYPAFDITVTFGTGDTSATDAANATGNTPASALGTTAPAASSAPAATATPASSVTPSVSSTPPGGGLG